MKENNPETDENTLLEKVQKLLDRFLFICFCEDKGLLEKDFFRIIGENPEKYDITYPNSKFELIIYLRNLNTNEVFKLNRSFSLYFKKKGYEFFILSV